MATDPERGPGRRQPRLDPEEQAVVRALTLKFYGSQARLARELGEPKSTVHAWLRGKQGVPPSSLKRLAVLLGTSVEALRAEAARRRDRLTTEARPAADPAEYGLAGSRPGAGATPAARDSVTDGAPTRDRALDLSAGGGGLRPGGVWVYPGYSLWDRDDPRDQTTVPAALEEGRRRLLAVGRDTARIGRPPDEAFAVLVHDNSLSHIVTPAGRIEANWTVFVDRRLALAAQPGAVVAVYAPGRIDVGVLRADAEGLHLVSKWGQRVAFGRDDILGEAVSFQPPPVGMAWEEREAGPAPAGLGGPPPREPAAQAG